MILTCKKNCGAWGTSLPTCLGRHGPVQDGEGAFVPQDSKTPKKMSLKVIFLDTLQTTRLFSLDMENPQMPGESK